MASSSQSFDLLPRLALLSSSDRLSLWDRRSPINRFSSSDRVSVPDRLSFVARLAVPDRFSSSPMVESPLSPKIGSMQTIECGTPVKAARNLYRILTWAAPNPVTSVTGNESPR
jgi:hypothetical protein